MKRYDIRNPDDREYVEHVLLGVGDLFEPPTVTEWVTPEEWKATQEAKTR